MEREEETVNVKKILSLFLALALLVAAPAAVLADTAGTEDGTAAAVPEAPGEDPTATPEPIVVSVPVQEGFPCEELPEPESASIYMVSLDTDTVVYTHNPDERRSVASLTKIMTYIAVIESVKDPENTWVTVPQSVLDELYGTNSSTAELLVGEELTVLELLNLMMVPSANDAALTLQKYVDSLNLPVTNSAFDENGDGLLGCIELMNQRARELGCTDTHFVNSHGLYDPNHYSTARDMGILAKYAMKQPYFADIVSHTSYELRATNMRDWSREFLSTNRLMHTQAEEYYKYATGIKTGSLDEAGYCVAASGTYEGNSYVVVCLGAPMYDGNGYEINVRGEMHDARTLLRWAFLNIESRPIVSDGDLLGEVDLKYVWNKDRLQLVAQGNMVAMLPEDFDTTRITSELDIPELVEAPVQRGDAIGTATFYYEGSRLAEIKLVAAESVERSEIIQTVEKGKEVLTSPWFLITAGSIVVLTVIYFVVAITLNRRRRRERARRVRKYRNFE